VTRDAEVSGTADVVTRITNAERSSSYVFLCRPTYTLTAHVQPLRALTLGGTRSTALCEFNIGSHPAVQMVATVTDIATDACNGPSAFHTKVVTTVPKSKGLLPSSSL